jgi:tetratricopeptide (TPR) repeat protein
MARARESTTLPDMDADELDPPRDAGTLKQYLHDNGPRPPRSRRLILGGAIVALVVLLLVGGRHPVLALAPWGGLLGLMGWLVYQRHTLLRARRSLNEMRELTMLRRNRRAAQMAYRLIPQLRVWPDFHAQAVMLLADNCMQIEAWEPAIGTYDFLLERLDQEGPTTQVLRAQRTLGLLHDDRLADADAELRRLGHHAHAPLAAALHRAAELYRRVKTHHDPQALAETDRQALRRTLSPLGVEAGYYYALIAEACRRAGRADLAAPWWRDATLLLPPQRIASHVPETAPLAESHSLPSAPALAEVVEADAA